MWRRISLGVATISLVLFVYASAIQPILQCYISVPAIIAGVIGNALVLTVFSLTHALYCLGSRRTAAFFVLTIVISWVYEQIGVATGWVYGSYHYTDFLGWKLGYVPVLIPLAWFMMLYPSYVIANLIVGIKSAREHSRWVQIILLALTGAVAMTAWGLIIDPVLSGPKYAAWIWEERGLYFGVPLHNFAGWFITSISIYLAYYFWERRYNFQPINHIEKPITAMSLIAYGSIIILNYFEGDVMALRFLGFVIMGIPLFAAAIRLKTCD